jgi:hypothetical protein
MWFLIKGTFWFAAVLVVLSYFSGRPMIENNGTSALEVAGALSAATEAYQYVSALCSEKPEVCEKGSETFSALGVRAKEGALVAFELLDGHFGSGKKVADTALLADPEPTPFPGKQAQAAAAPEADVILTGTIPVPQKRPIH